MPTQILIKKSTTASAVPTTSDITTGELAVNTADKRLFTNNSGTIVELGINPSSVTTGAITASSGTVSGNWTVSGTLTVATPSGDTDAASKAYVDTAVSNLVDAAPGALDTLNELAAAIGDDANFSTTITNSLATKLNLSGGTMTGDIVLGANKITSTATPATDDTLTRKGYVDSILGSATAAATSAANAATSESNAATSETNAATSASNASTSETNAATSETNAGNSATSASNSASAASTSASNAATSETNALNAYDSFDDRYLGAKASAPTLDNDGDALIAGALYFNTTDDKMQVYSGSAWGDVSPTATSVTEAQISDLGTTIVLDSDIGVTVQGYDADTVKTDTAQTFTADQTFSDNTKAIFGTGSDLQIYHDSITNNSYIAESGVGDLVLQGTNMRLQNASGDYYVRAYNGGAVNMYHNNAQKFATTATGVDVTGTVTADGVKLGDNEALFCGDGDDLKIFHNGSNSQINDLGTGKLQLLSNGTGVDILKTDGEVMATFVNDGAVSLYYDNSAKLATTSTGIDVTGTVATDRATGTLTTDNDLSFDMNASNYFKCTPTGNGTLTFTNITSGQSGNIWLDNSAGVTITAAATTYISATDLTTISTAGVYFLSYYADGTNVLVSCSQAVTSAGA